MGTRYTVRYNKWSVPMHFFSLEDTEEFIERYVLQDLAEDMAKGVIERMTDELFDEYKLRYTITKTEF